MKISVIGRGDVGAVSCACLPELGQEAIGVEDASGRGVGDRSLSLVSTRSSGPLVRDTEIVVSGHAVVRAAAGLCSEGVV